MDSLNFNSVETLPNLSARAAFQVNSSAVFKEDIDIVPVIIDDTLSRRVNFRCNHLNIIYL